MSDIRAVGMSGASMPREGQEQLEQLRKQVGAGFTDKPEKLKKNKNEMGKDDFMKLMAAQLKYQDPVTPMKNEEMAAQLAQFSALEQMFNVNQNLEKMAAGQKPQENVLAASLIGKKIISDSARLNLEKDKSTTINFDLPADAMKGSVSVVNAKGEVVRELSLVGAKSGPQKIVWDGKNDKGLPLDPGEYSFKVSALDKQEKPIQASLSEAGIITGVSFEGGKPFLLMGDKKLALATVTRIEEPTAKDLAELRSGNKKSQQDSVKTPTDLSGKNNIDASEQKGLSSAEPRGTIEDKEILPSAKENTLESYADPSQEGEQEVGANKKAVTEQPQELADNDVPRMNGMALWDPNN